MRVRPHNDAVCIYVSQDNEMNRLLNSCALILEVYGYTCRHPDNHTLAVDWRYSRRAARDKTDPELETAAESFLNGLEFNNPLGIKDL
jgi:hypothetical protein